MIGNDIVDLKLAQIESDWRRKGFLDKVYSSGELAMITSSLNPDLMVWRLWSMKESVYKASLSIKKQIRLNPKDFECHIISPSLGRVLFEGMVYDTISVINDDYVHTQAEVENFDEDLIFEVICSDQKDLTSESLYKNIQSYIGVRKGWASRAIELKKNKLGIPEVYFEGTKKNIRVSFSHHGRYGAFLTTC